MQAQPIVDAQRHARLIGAVIGLLLFAGMLIMPTPEAMPPAAQRMAAIALLMAALWVAESLPLPVTGLLPLILYPALDVMSTKAAAPYYANRWVFLLMGGFFIAMAMQKWQLDRRIALEVIRRVGVSSRRLVLGFMLATGFISMWISNSATTMMMMPIALAIMVQIEDVSRAEGDGTLPRNVVNFSAALALGIAYAANIGGVATLVGTFPNVVFQGQVETLMPGASPPGFTTWLLFALPFTVVFIPVIWVVMVFFLLPVHGELIASAHDIIEREIAKLGKMKRGEVATLVVFVLTAVLWISRGNLALGAFTIPGWSNLLGLQDVVDDATVAICMGTILFVIPLDFEKGEYVLDWEYAAKLPWGLLLLFSSGFAIAGGFTESGLSVWIGSRLEILQDVPTPVMVFIIALVITFLTEMTSNTATTTMMMPILYAAAIGMRTHPYVLMLPAVISASCAFMLPIATPPNAIVFTTGRVTMRQMFRTGLVLNIIGAILVTVLIMTTGRIVMGADPSVMPEWALPHEALAK